MNKQRSLKQTLSIKLFKEWLNKQKPSRKFKYDDNNGCLIASFVKETSPHLNNRLFCGGWDIQVNGKRVSFNDAFTRISDAAIRCSGEDINHKFTVKQFKDTWNFFLEHKNTKNL